MPISKLLSALISRIMLIIIVADKQAVCCFIGNKQPWQCQQMTLVAQQTGVVTVTPVAVACVAHAGGVIKPARRALACPLQDDGQ